MRDGVEQRRPQRIRHGALVKQCPIHSDRNPFEHVLKGQCALVALFNLVQEAFRLLRHTFGCRSIRASAKLDVSFLAANNMVRTGPETAGGQNLQHGAHGKRRANRLVFELERDGTGRRLVF